MGFPCVRSVSAKKRKEKLFLLPSNVSKLNIKAKRITKIPYPNESLGGIGGNEIGEYTEAGSDGEDEDEEEEGVDMARERNFTSVQDSCEMLKARRHLDARDGLSSVRVLAENEKLIESPDLVTTRGSKDKSMFLNLEVDGAASNGGGLDETLVQVLGQSSDSLRTVLPSETVDASQTLMFDPESIHFATPNVLGSEGIPHPTLATAHNPVSRQHVISAQKAALPDLGHKSTASVDIPIMSGINCLAVLGVKELHHDDSGRVATENRANGSDVELTLPGRSALCKDSSLVICSDALNAPDRPPMHPNTWTGFSRSCFGSHSYAGPTGTFNLDFAEGHASSQSKVVGAHQVTDDGNVSMHTYSTGAHVDMECVQVGPPTRPLSDQPKRRTDAGSHTDKTDSQSTPLRQANRDCKGATGYTWAGLLKTATPDFLLTHVNLESCKQVRKLVVPSTITAQGGREWHNTLVGFFLDRKLPYSFVVRATTKLWENAGLVDILASDQGTFYFKFDTRSSLDAVLEGGPWYIAGRPIILRKWESHISLEKNRISKIPLWVHFYNIPLEYWTQEGLSYIASMIGKPLYVDKTIASRRRITYARICIEVDASDEWIYEFVLESNDGKQPISVKVEYQWTPTRCSECKCFGHNCQAHIRTKPKTSTPNVDQQWVPVKQVPSDQSAPVTIPKASPEEGQWNVIRRQRKGKEVALKEDVDVPRPFLASGSAAPIKTQLVRTSNSFNALIPFVYEVEESASPHVSGEAPFEEEAEEGKDFIKEMEEVDSVIPMSSRQKKKEAKKLFSGNRPKGRHRT